MLTINESPFTQPEKESNGDNGKKNQSTEKIMCAYLNVMEINRKYFHLIKVLHEMTQ